MTSNIDSDAYFKELETRPAFKEGQLCARGEVHICLNERGQNPYAKQNPKDRQAWNLGYNTEMDILDPLA